MSRFRILVLLPGLVCACSGPTFLDADPEYTGFIVEVDGTRLLVRQAADPCGTWTSIDQFTHIRIAGTPASLEDLEVGDTVDVWFRGDIALSCPGQAAAETVLAR